MARSFRVTRALLTKAYPTLAAYCEASGGHVVQAPHWPIREKPRKNRPPHAWLSCDRCGARVCVYGADIDGAHDVIRVYHKGKQVAGPKGEFAHMEVEDTFEVPGEEPDVITAGGVTYGKKGAA